MGIRFYCPNGHKLNVKSFLAGKRGICPHCDARFDIPNESQISGAAPRVRSGQAAEQPAVSMATGLGVAAAPGIDLESAEASPMAAGSSAAAAGDPIAEAPDAVWYVRPPAGGQFGPARGDVLRQWIKEGRVSADSMVWREGWPDWKTAGPIFSELSPVPPLNDSADVGTTQSTQVPEVGTQSPSKTRGQVTAGRSRRNRKSLAAVICLGLLIVVLLVVLVQVST